MLRGTGTKDFRKICRKRNHWPNKNLSFLIFISIISFYYSLSKVKLCAFSCHVDIFFYNMTSNLIWTIRQNNTTHKSKEYHTYIFFSRNKSLVEHWKASYGFQYCVPWSFSIVCNGYSVKRWTFCNQGYIVVLK